MVINKVKLFWLLKKAKINEKYPNLGESKVMAEATKWFHIPTGR